jgi:hypothetical protein
MATMIEEKQFQKCQEFYTDWQTHTAQIRVLMDKLKVMQQDCWRQFHENQEICPHLEWKDSGGGAFGYKTCLGCGMDDL